MNYVHALNRFTHSMECKKCSKPMAFEQMVDFDDLPQRAGDSFEAAKAICCGFSHTIKGTFLEDI